MSLCLIRRLRRGIEELMPEAGDADHQAYMRQLSLNNTNSLWDRPYTIYFTTSPKPPAAVAASLAGPEEACGPAGGTVMQCTMCTL